MKLTFLLRSGNKFTVEVVDCQIDTYAGKVTNMRLTEPVPATVHHLDLAQIEAILELP